MGESENRVVDLAIQNGGLVSRDQAIALGMSKRTLARRVETNHLVAIAPGILALPGAIQTERGLLGAAAAGIGAVASHQSAARLHGFDLRDTLTVSVTVPIRRSNRFHTVVVHESTDLAASETTWIEGIPVTDPPRTLIDLATVASRYELANLVDEAVRRRLTTYDSVAIRLESIARKGKPGVVKLRGVLESRESKPKATESNLEMRVLRLLTTNGLPAPSPQFRPPWLRAINGRVDFAYIDKRVIVEADSKRWHDSPEAFQRDRERDNLAQIAGWTILRFTWSDLIERPSYLVATVREVLERSTLV